jgi:hypothetical protein
MNGNWICCGGKLGLFVMGYNSIESDQSSRAGINYRNWVSQLLKMEGTLGIWG